MCLSDQGTFRAHQAFGVARILFRAMVRKRERTAAELFERLRSIADDEIKKAR